MRNCKAQHVHTSQKYRAAASNTVSNNELHEVLCLKILTVRCVTLLVIVLLNMRTTLRTAASTSKRAAVVGAVAPFRVSKSSRSLMMLACIQHTVQHTDV
jgi:hypothetical protein